MDKWTRAFFHPSLPLTDEGFVTQSRKHIDLSCRTAQEGMVLLKNDGPLPLKKGTPVCLMGKGSFDYVKGGGGSGDVHPSYILNLYDGIERLCPGSVYAPMADYYRDYVQAQYAKRIEPGMLSEPEVPAALLAEAAKAADVAIISISRFSGEDWDRPCGFPCGEDDPWLHKTDEERFDKGVFRTGDFALTPAERAMVDATCAAFKTVIAVLNVGGVVDTAWIKEDERIGAALLAWQGGMEGGLAAARLLYGDANPCGRLPDTFPMHISDFPSTANFHESVNYVNYTEDVYVGYRYFQTIPGKAERVCYPFGYGLSYTTFDMQTDAVPQGRGAALTVRVTNTGAMAGREVVQVYCAAPQGKLGKPARVLCGFHKTALLQPGQTETATLTISLDSIASYDDVGAVCQSAYVLEQGDYTLLVGRNVCDADAACTITLEADVVVEQLACRLAPTSLPSRLQPDGTYAPQVCTAPYDLNEGHLAADAGKADEGCWPEVKPIGRYLPYNDHQGRIQLRDVAAGRASMDDLIAQLSDEELYSLLCGQPDQSVSNVGGIGNLYAHGIPNMLTADGPAGVRINPWTGPHTTAFPCGTLMAATFDPVLVEEIGAAGGAELKENNLAIWLTPAVNIHRNPLCGRNFEYYSEDPLLAGLTGAAMVRGIQSNGVSACVKHFACNDKETNRRDSDSRLSERALREIYLKQFEIIVKTGKPLAIMTAYNAINGRRSSESRELLTDILRGEWGYEGMVMTDWWNFGEQYKEVLAGNDVKMNRGYPARLAEAQQAGLITRADVKACVRRVLEYIIKMD